MSFQNFQVETLQFLDKNQSKISSSNPKMTQDVQPGMEATSSKAMNIADKIISGSNKPNEKRESCSRNLCGGRKRKLPKSASQEPPNNKRRRICNCTRNIHSRKCMTKKKESSKPFDYLAQFGKNFCCASLKNRTGLRPIYIDGTNVAFSHGQNERFSVKGLKICIDYFLKRGHDVRAFIPNFRLRRNQSSDQKLLHRLVKQRHVIVTPTLYIKNKQRSPYDNWYIVQSAAANGGIIVSSDNFQDIKEWNPNLREVAEERRLVPTFVDDMLIFPMDPQGNRRNNLEQFLKF
ncbi:unnamed protein product [Ceutorhynchus assimilis]|uniref:RNase NYN domain-containing protein n=1 Tax=Ceutorhynchus assimilis TaxID=467358 RepID=A0A9N9QLY5_9CUCU|nr:unnamed protein product [Ceutorhynchus assimilis]